MGMTVRAAHQKFIFQKKTFVISMGVTNVQRFTRCLCYFLLNGSNLFQTCIGHIMLWANLVGIVKTHGLYMCDFPR